MGTGPIFCCYVLKLRMSSFLQNGAWPHFFCMITAFVLGANYLLINSPFLRSDFELHCLQHLIVWADYIHMPVSNLMSLDCF